MAERKEYPTQENLSNRFVYKDGCLIYRITAGRGHVGHAAGRITKHGYIEIIISGKNYMAHRLIWIYHYGQDPDLDIDHIDRNRANNRIENLRLVTRSQNNHNAKPRVSKYKYGCNGVCWHSGSKVFEATIQINKKRFRLGRGDYLHCCALRKSAELKYKMELNLPE